MNVQTHIQESSEATAKAVAEALLQLVLDHHNKRPFSIALSGGSTPKLLYQKLAQTPYLETFPWERISFFFGDERPVPPEHKDSNYRMAKDALLSHIPSTHFRMEAEVGNADGYEEILRENLPLNPHGIPQFNLILLGIGADGHTASLFPKTQALQEQERCVVMNEVPQQNTTRMTLTYPVIQAAQHIWIVATGASKQPIVQGVLQPDPLQEPPAWPVLKVKPTEGELTWWLDQNAAATLAT